MGRMTKIKKKSKTKQQPQKDWTKAAARQENRTRTASSAEVVQLICIRRQRKRLLGGLALGQSAKMPKPHTSHTTLL